MQAGVTERKCGQRRRYIVDDANENAPHTLLRADPTILSSATSKTTLEKRTVERRILIEAARTSRACTAGDRRC